MLHEATVPGVIMGQIRQIRAKTQRCNELLEIAGQARIDRIPLHIDESRIREYRINDADQVGVNHGLVDDSQRIAPMSLQEPEAVLGQFLARR